MYSVWKQENYLTKIHLRCEFDLEYVILHEAIMQLEGHERMPRSPLEQLWGITEPALLQTSLHPTGPVCGPTESWTAQSHSWTCFGVSFLPSAIQQLRKH